jgi:chromosome partitioning protein
MKVIAFATQKGGAGKSSLVVSLAVAAQERGQKVYVIDLDPQGTARNWFERRQADAPEVAALDASRLASALATLRKQKHDLVLIDTQGVDSPATVAAMKAADLCLIPSRPSVADIEAARPTVGSLAKLKRPFAFILTQCSPRPTQRSADAFRALQLLGMVSTASIAQRTDHVDALAVGQGVTERDPDGRAASEVRALLDWITNRLNKGKSHGEETRIA